MRYVRQCRIRSSTLKKGEQYGSHRRNKKLQVLSVAPEVSFTLAWSCILKQSGLIVQYRKHASYKGHEPFARIYIYVPYRQKYLDVHIYLQAAPCTRSPVCHMAHTEKQTTYIFFYLAILSQCGCVCLLEYTFSFLVV